MGTTIDRRTALLSLASCLATHDETGAMVLRERADRDAGPPLDGALFARLVAATAHAGAGEILALLGRSARGGAP